MKKNRKKSHYIYFLRIILCLLFMLYIARFNEDEKEHSCGKIHTSLPDTVTWVDNTLNSPHDPNVLSVK